MNAMLRRLPALLPQIAGDADVRAYVRYAAFRPRLWRVERPDLTPRTPEYLDGVTLTPVGAFRPAPLRWGSQPIAQADTFDLALPSTTLKRVLLDAVPWTMTFADGEDEASLHRFAWLLPWVVERRGDGASAEAVWDRAVTSMSDWIRAHPSPAHVEAWQPYTVSERIVNWILTAAITGHLPLPDALRSSVAKQAEHLGRTLEYYGARFTGNHLSNNGRALYFAAAATDRKDLAAMGRTILREEWRRVFSDSGFLREGSSHYQFLTTRNYQEAEWVATQIGDVEFAAELSESDEAMRRACAFFLVRQPNGWRMPLIGDISPDVTPEWLVGVAADVHTGWRDLFPDAKFFAARAESTREWARIDADGWTVFAHVNVNGTPIIPGHAHHDTGGVSVWFEGEQVLVDCGRRHYLPDDAGHYGASGWSHCLLSVDGLSPEPTDWWFLDREFVRRRAGAAPTLTASETAIRIDHHGFERSRGVGACRRDVRAERRVLTVSDAVEGTGEHRVTVVFHLPNGTLRGDRVDFNAGDMAMTVELPSDLRTVRLISADEEGTFGWAARRYGDASPVASVIAEARVALPWRGVATIRVRG